MIQRIILALAVSFSFLTTNFAQTQSPAKPAQTPPPAPTSLASDKDDVVRITTNLVQVDAVVLKNGKPVKDLKAEDFELYEDGHRQVITSFAYISKVPTEAAAPATTNPAGSPFPTKPLNPKAPGRTVALVVDDLGLSHESMNQVRRQLRKFVAEQLAPNDLVAVIRTGGKMGALQQFTNDRRITNRAIDQLKWSVCSRVGVSVITPAGRPGGLGPNSLFGPCGGRASVSETLRAFKFVVEAMGELPGRKTMVVFSDSLPREEQDVDFNRDGLSPSRVNTVSPDYLDYNNRLRLIAERAIRSSVVIYAVDAGGLQFTGLTAADKIEASSQSDMNRQINNLLTSRSMSIWNRREGAELIARETGGFLVRNSNDFQLNRILEEESGYYLIGYRPSEETFNKRFHHIKAKVKRSGMSLRTRKGFYGFTEEEANKIKRTSADQATVALMSPFGAQDINLDLTAFFADEKDKGSFVRSFVFLDPKDLTFNEDANGWSIANVQFRGIVFGDNGEVVNQVTHDRTLNLRGETFKTALRDGLSIQFDIPVKRSGSYQMRVSARDISSGRIGSMGQVVIVPDLKSNALALSGVVMRGVVDNSSSAEANAGAGPAVRNYMSGQNVFFNCVIYNASLDSSNQPNLTMQARLFRDAKEVYTSPDMKVSAEKQQDLKRLVSSGFIRLDPSLEPGSYYLQLTVTDKLREKQHPITQWIDFEIVK